MLGDDVRGSRSVAWARCLPDGCVDVLAVERLAVRPSWSGVHCSTLRAQGTIETARSVLDDGEALYRVVCDGSLKGSSRNARATHTFRRQAAG
jgi:hypothetical protein